MAKSLSDLAQAASRAVSSGTAPPWLRIHIAAGCDAVLGSSVLAARAPELPATSAFKIAAACTLVFGPGAAQLEAELQKTQHSADSEGAFFRLWDGCRAQLAAVAHVLTTLLPSDQPKAAAAFAGSTGKPAALLPWLQTASQGLLGLAESTAGPDAHPGANCGI